MSEALILNSGIAAFVPAHQRTKMNADDRAAVSEEIREELRRELEAEYAVRLERELEAARIDERRSFDEALDRCNRNFDECIKSLRKEIQHSVMDFSIRLAEVIVRHELPDREMLRNLIVKTLEPVSDLQGALVRISPQDRELFGCQLDESNPLDVGRTVQFAEDPNLGIGDMIVESRNGIFDARLNERLKLLKEALYERSGRTVSESHGS